MQRKRLGQARRKTTSYITGRLQRRPDSAEEGGAHRRDTEQKDFSPYKKRYSRRAKVQKNSEKGYNGNQEVSSPEIA